jgi:DNA-binding response OmpR family regulator
VSADNVVVVASDVALGHLVASVLRRGHFSVSAVVSAPADLEAANPPANPLVVGHIASDTDLRLLRLAAETLGRPPVLVLLADTAGTPQQRALEGFVTDLLRLPASPDNIVDLVRALSETRDLANPTASTRPARRAAGSP